MCRISIVIPICNVENYVRKCVESVMDQTLQDIEIICVDDASTDASLAILRECEKRDPRVRVIAYDTNKSASQARKDGALLAKGEYIMFLDGDDYLERNACEELYGMISEKNVDMLQFGTKIINEGKVEERRIRNVQGFLEPYQERLEKGEVFSGCFIEKKYHFTIWNKIYRSSLCKKAFPYVKDGNFPKAQDLYAFFLLCYFAESYYGVENAYYNYRFGTGITGNEELSLSQLERFCSSAYVADAIADFVAEQGEGKYGESVKALRKNLLNDCVNNWVSYISLEESAQGFDLLCQYWGKAEVVSSLCARHYTKKKRLAEKVLGAESIQSKEKKAVKTVGVFYHRYTAGGVQRVISMLIPMYMEMGYHVVLFTDEFSEENEFDLPEGAVRITLPSSLAIPKEEYSERAQLFLEKIKEYKVDVICYQAASSPMLFFDLLLLKLHRIPVILTVHEAAFQNVLTMNPEMVTRPSIYRLADCVTVLSRIEQKYWRSFGVNAIYIPNPINAQIIQRDLSQVEKNTILWIGRLDPRTKRCLDVVDVMKHVTRFIPDAKLLVVGGEPSTGVWDKMERKIQKNGLEDRVILCGYDTDVAPYYCRCELHIITSISESFSMTIAESKSYGMPLVMYELPFIEFSRDGRGSVNVPQGDVKGMAKAIVRILSDEEYKRRLQEEAHESLKGFLAFDLKGEWKKLFSELEAGKKTVEEDEAMRILLQSFLHHYEYGVMINGKRKNALQKKVDKLQERTDKLRGKVCRLRIKTDRLQERVDKLQAKVSRLQEKDHKLQEVKNSLDYKLGHAALFFPHKVSRGWKKRKKDS